MKKHLFMIGLIVLTLLWSVSLFAQQGQQAASGQSSGSNQMLITQADSLKGSDVKNERGEKLGTVESVSLDLANGKISYVVIDPGSGSNLIPVPFDMFGVTRGKTLVLKMDKNRFAQAPSYAKKSQPNWADAGWTNWVSNFWGTAPSGVLAAQTGGSRQQTTASSGQTPQQQAPQQMGSQQQQQPGQAPIDQQPYQQQTGRSQQPMTGQEPQQQPMSSQSSRTGGAVSPGSQQQQ